MRCPNCNNELKVTGQELLETLNEHVSCSPVKLKDKYECSAPECP